MKVKKVPKKQEAKPTKKREIVVNSDTSENSSGEDDDSVDNDPEEASIRNDKVIRELEGDNDSESEDEVATPKPKISKKAAPEIKEAPEEKKLAYDKEEEKKTVFCGNIPNGPNVNETRIKDIFSEYGSIKSVRFRTEAGKVIFSKKIRKDCKNFIAYVVFEKEEHAKKSIQLNGYKLLDNHLRVNMANNKKETFSNKGCIFVGNLLFDALETEIHEYFSQVGNIEYVRKIANKGIAYVSFSKGVNISKALKLNELPFKGRNLRISRCESKDKQDKKKLFKKDERTGRIVKQKVRRPHKINEEAFMRGRSNNNPIIKKIKDTQKAKYNRFTDAQKLSKKELFRRGGKMEQNQREDTREKTKKKQKFFGAKVDGMDKTKNRKTTKASKSVKQQKVIAKKLKSAAARGFGMKT